MNPDRKKSRGIYLLPNLLTTAALLSGFYAIFFAFQGRFEAGAMAIFAAMVFDWADGRIARITGTESAFGAEYDSLADMVAFGIAPVVLAAVWSLDSFGKAGWLAGFCYTAATALRLARFNTQVGVADKKYFQGLPCPAAAAVVTGLVWVGVDRSLAGPSLGLETLTVVILASLLMVSNIRFRSFKEFDIRERIHFVTVLVVVLGFTLIAIDPALLLFMGFGLYALSGPVETLIQVRRARRRRRMASGERVRRPDA
jgi:CDP-diacylglycerol--serine O-phosphatidyltransferase